MEGHLEIPNEEPNLIPEIEKEWKKLYFRTKDGRFQRFAVRILNYKFMTLFDFKIITFLF